jgi:hypothetical protein
MNQKITVLTIAIIAIGVFALPNTLALFSGQHTFDKPGNTTICAKCHSDVISEIQAGSYHKSLIPTSGSNTECKGCHTTSTIGSNLIPLGNGTGNASGSYNVGFNISTGNFTRANGSNITGYGAHAAITVECASCHYAVNFTDDAHRSFSDNSTSQTWLKGANEICVGCHTKTRVEMTWARKGGYNYSYDFMNSTGTFSFNNTFVNVTTNNTG